MKTHLLLRLLLRIGAKKRLEFHPEESTGFASRFHCLCKLGFRLLRDLFLELGLVDTCAKATNDRVRQGK